MEVGDLHRFKSFDALNHFVGLCPDSHSSGEREKHTGLGDRRHNLFPLNTRSIFKGLYSHKD
ncbi:transposase [Paraflavisolibacter caeni]|uniref:transposase n=1 Tax=Paraflavisolibacter caeni TaxID=2982496 RepID=UPI003C6DDF5F